MGWLDKIMGRQTLATPSEMDAAWNAAAPSHEYPPIETAKTGEQIGKMSDPQGKRIYHEYSVGEQRADGTFPWFARVYTSRGQHSEANEVADTYALARANALKWAMDTRETIQEQP